MINVQLKKLREERGLNQTQLAQRLNVSKQSLSNWENDNILPSVEAVVSIARFFGVSTDYLLGLDQRRSLDATGLTESQAAHIQLLIDDMTQLNKTP